MIFAEPLDGKERWIVVIETALEQLEQSHIIQFKAQMETKEFNKNHSFMSHSTIVGSPNTYSRSDLSFGGSFNEFIDTRRRVGQAQNQQRFGSQFQTDSPTREGFYPGKNLSYQPTLSYESSQKPEDASSYESANLTKSTIIDGNDVCSPTTLNFANKLQTKKSFLTSKFVNFSNSKTTGVECDQRLEEGTFLKNIQSSPTDSGQKRVTQNLSFQQKSPKRTRNPEDSFSFKGFGLIDAQPVPPNNLQEYKKMEFNPGLRTKKSISSPYAGNIKASINNVAVTATSKTPSPNSSFEQNLIIKREFSSGRLNAGLKYATSESPISNSDVNYFGAGKVGKETTSTNPDTSKSKTHSPPIRKDDFEIIRQLGKGKYGDVFLAQNKQLGLLCALKVITKEIILKQEGGINQFGREVIIQMFLSHPCVVQLWGIFSDEQNVYLIMQPATDGQLYKYMKQRRQLQESEAASLIKQLCIGVEYLQEQQVIHRDLKPENIIMYEGQLKICDFGWAVYNQDSFRQTFCGTPLYLSPDVLKGEHYNDKVDNWAIGIITYEMIVGRIPFKITKESQLDKILFQEIQFPEHIQISDSAKDFILCLLDKNPESRMDIENILNHPFLCSAN